MSNKKTIGLILSFIFLISSSCITTRKLTYLENNGLREEFIAITPATYIIQPYDNLFIRIVTPNPQWADMFNTLPTSITSMSLNELSADMLSYTVDDEGFIELPYAGKFNVAGKTINAVKQELDEALDSYVTDAVVTIKMVNNYVSVLGEIQRPGRYPIYKDRLNVFQALAMAGDIGIFGNRQTIQLIRQTPEGNTVREFSLKDKSIIGSQYFYIMPNDVLYVPPVKGRFFRMDALPYSIILSTLTTVVLIWSVIK